MAVDLLPTLIKPAYCWWPTGLCQPDLLLVFVGDIERLDCALVKLVDAVYQLTELYQAGSVKVGIRMVIEAGQRNGVSFRPSPAAVASIGEMTPRDAARLLDRLAAEATADGVAGEAVVDVDGDGKVRMIKPFNHDAVQ